MQPRRILLLLFLGVAGAAIVVGVWYWRRMPPRLSSRPSRAKALPVVRSASPDFDLVYQLPGSPLGLAGNGRELVFANRSDPWGVIRVRRDGDELEAQQITLIEPVYQQRMNVDALTWNGTNYIGYTTASWFARREGRVFTIHDPATMQVIEHRPAPDQLGCLAWDGSTYWAATRRNTEASPEPAHLYRLDRAFQIIGTFDTPGVGCQGLAWDGKLLWFADVFDDAIHVLDVSGRTPRVISTSHPNLSYLGGVALFEGEIWIAEYDHDRLHRIRPSTRVAWSRDATAPPPATTLASVLTSLRSERTNSFSKRPADDTEVLDWSIELRDGALWASWNFWFGLDLFSRREASGPITIPQFARYTLTIKRPDGTSIEHEYEAIPGVNSRRDVQLLENASAPGDYSVSLFMHVQFVTPDGASRILNNSAGSLTVTR
jgi:hypothetical protein